MVVVEEGFDGGGRVACLRDDCFVDFLERDFGAGAGAGALLVVVWAWLDWLGWMGLLDGPGWLDWLG